MGLRRALLGWYRRHQRDLPWRRSPDPYKVWVSEIMLQQTQVAAATPYYERFVAKFPDVRALARADRARVMALWAGLGYYRRARHLHEAAGIVVREHDGRVPSDPRAFGSLPGVGRYTLGAVLSMGFGLSWPVLDGNVARVISRVTARPLAVKRPADAKKLWALATEWMPPAARARSNGGGPGEWNQALMELGALICTPRAPKCTTCPVRAHCRALALGRVDRLPPVVDRRATERVRRAVACVVHRGKLLVTPREGTLLAGLWEPPGVELVPREKAAPALEAALRELGVRARLADTGERERHTITHRDITVELWEGALAGAAPRAGRRLRWAAAGTRALGLTALGARLARRFAAKA
jgi:A/G-specific adenine glycosylase